MSWYCSANFFWTVLEENYVDALMVKCLHKLCQRIDFKTYWLPLYRFPIMYLILVVWVN